MVRVYGGWRPIGSLEMSDHVAVFSGGYRQPAQIKSEEIWLDPFDCPAVVRPLLVPQEAIGNDRCLRLQQDMRVVLDSGTRAGAFEAAHVSVRAADLCGFRNIALERTPPRKAMIHRVLFDGAEAIEVAGGTWLLCPPAHTPLNVLIDGSWGGEMIGARPVRHLTAGEAAVFLSAWDARGSEKTHHV